MTMPVRRKDGTIRLSARSIKTTLVLGAHLVALVARAGALDL
jgi:hypothetical protein